MELLTKQDDIVADLKDRLSQTPLMMAARHRRKALVKLFVKRDDVVADSKDRYS